MAGAERGGERGGAATAATRAEAAAERAETAAKTLEEKAAELKADEAEKKVEDEEKTSTKAAEKKAALTEKQTGRLIEDRSAAKSRLELSEADWQRINGLSNEQKVVLSYAEIKANDEALAKYAEDRRQYAKLTIELHRSGALKELSAKDLEIIREDLAASGEKSAQAELFLQRSGFKNFQEMMRTLGLKEITVGGKTIPLEKQKGLDKLSPFMKEQLKKMGISGTTSLAVATAITLAGGPVSWLTIAGGLAGGAGGRYGGELIRRAMLGGKVESAPGSDEKIQFREKYGRDMLETIIQLQNAAQSIGDDPLKYLGKENSSELSPEELIHYRTEALLKLTQQMTTVEARSQKDYERLEKRAGWIKSGLAIAGAVGGSYLASALQFGQTAERLTENSEAQKEAWRQAKEQGVRIFHDATGQAHITLDPNQGHLVKESTDGAWRFVIENKDITEAIQEHSLNNYHYFIDSQTMEVLQAQGYPTDGLVPDQLPVGQELQHNSVISDVASIINEKYGAVASKISADYLSAQLVASAIATGSTAIAEGWGAYKNRSNREKIRRDDKRLLESIDEVRAMLHDKLLLPNDEITIVGPIPEDPKEREDFYKRLAELYRVEVPKNPEGEKFMINWELQSQKFPKKDFDFDAVPAWRYRDDRSLKGEFIKVGVIRVNLDRNKIAIARLNSQEATGAAAYDVEVIDLTKFLREYKPFIKDMKGDPKATASAKSSMPGVVDSTSTPDNPSPTSEGSQATELPPTPTQEGEDDGPVEKLTDKKLQYLVRDNLIYQDINLDSITDPEQRQAVENALMEERARIERGELHENEVTYAQALEDIRGNYTAQQVNNRVRSLQNSVNRGLARLGIEPSPYTGSRTWAKWDLAKQWHYMRHPGEADKNYTVANPFRDENKFNEIIDRQLGWEIYANGSGKERLDPDSELFLPELKRVVDESSVGSQIRALLEEKPKAGDHPDLPSYKLAQLGELVWQASQELSRKNDPPPSGNVENDFLKGFGEKDAEPKKDIEPTQEKPNQGSVRAEVIGEFLSSMGKFSSESLGKIGIVSRNVPVSERESEDYIVIHDPSKNISLGSLTVKKRDGKIDPIGSRITVTRPGAKEPQVILNPSMQDLRLFLHDVITRIGESSKATSDAEPQATPSVDPKEAVESVEEPEEPVAPPTPILPEDEPKPADQPEQEASPASLLEAKNLNPAAFDEGKTIRFRDQGNGERAEFLAKLKADLEFEGDISKENISIVNSETTDTGDRFLTLELNGKQTFVPLSELLRLGSLNLPKSARKK